MMEGEPDSDLFDLAFEEEEEEEDTSLRDVAAAAGFTEAEFATTQKVLEALRAQPELLQGTCFKSFRTLGISVFLKSTAGAFYGGKESREEYTLRRQRRKEQKRKEQMMRQLDFNHQNASKLRRERLEALSKQEEYETEYIPMLEAARGTEEAMDSPTQEVIEELDIEDPAFRAMMESNDVNERNEYFFPKSCYTCKARFLQRHHFYDRLCPPCAELNWTKRTQRADLQGRVVLLTGGRVKIGFQCGLKLLRDGCEVIVSTRFPQNAASRYLEVEDSGDWAHRVHFYGLDMRDLGAIVRLTELIKLKFKRLDGIVNNAAQTVRRPVAYYRHLLPDELAEPPEEVKARLLQPHNTKESLAYIQNEKSETSSTAMMGTGAPTGQDSSVRSALQSQVPVAAEDLVDDQALFPSGKYDVDKQQLDLRERNSWIMKLEEVLPIELVEVQCVNVMGPFILNSRLKDLMEMSPEPARFVVNVSAMEGKFYRAKTPFHPHTNMAKAGLNMMTKTCAGDYAKSGIYMNSVDTGWIHDENPFQMVQEHMKRGFQTPIDELDAAARVLDPIYLSALHGETPHGKFLKDYKETSW